MLHAKLYFEIGTIFEISLRKIKKKMSPSKYNLVQSAMKYFLMLHAKLYFGRDIIFEISLREIKKKMSPSKYNLTQSAIKYFLVLRAKLYFGRDIIFEISRSEISKMMSLPKEYSAAEGGKRLFTQPPSKEFLARCAKLIIIHDCSIQERNRGFF